MAKRGVRAPLGGGLRLTWRAARRQLRTSRALALPGNVCGSYARPDVTGLTERARGLRLPGTGCSPFIVPRPMALAARVNSSRADDPARGPARHRAPPPLFSLETGPPFLRNPERAAMTGTQPENLKSAGERAWSPALQCGGRCTGLEASLTYIASPRLARATR